MLRRGDGRGRRRRRGVGEVEAPAEMLEGVVKFGFSAGVEKLIGEGGTLRANRHQRIRGQKSLHHLKECFRDDFHGKIKKEYAVTAQNFWLLFQ